MTGQLPQRRFAATAVREMGIGATVGTEVDIRFTPSVVYAQLVARTVRRQSLVVIRTPPNLSVYAYRRSGGAASLLTDCFSVSIRSLAVCRLRGYASPLACCDGEADKSIGEVAAGPIVAAGQSAFRGHAEGKWPLVPKAWRSSSRSLFLSAA
jgi:hypothetical protein